MLFPKGLRKITYFKKERTGGELDPPPKLMSFPMSQLFASGGQSIAVSASASVLPMNTQDWSPLGWTGWISLPSKGLSWVFPNTTVQKHQFFDPDSGRDWGQEEEGTTEDEMAGWHHRLNGHEFEWTPGVCDGQGGLVCCNSWGRKELDTTEWLTELKLSSSPSTWSRTLFPKETNLLSWWSPNAHVHLENLQRSIPIFPISQIISLTFLFTVVQLYSQARLSIAFSLNFLPFLKFTEKLKGQYKELFLEPLE